MKASALEEMWWREREPGGARLALAPLALGEALFRAAVSVRGAAYACGLAAAARAGAPVISVGNLAVGGAGKTPAVLAIGERLIARGRRLAVLSRGYGARQRGERLASDGARLLLGAAEAGDEPLLLARRLPGAAVLCGPRRAELARRAVEELGADVLLLDDGFQHRALARDLDLVVVDAANPVGNGRLLPRGPNREAFSAIGRAQLSWLSRVDQAGSERLSALRARVHQATGRPPVESRHEVTDVLDGALARSFGARDLRGRPVLLLCALARPDGFRRTLASLGTEIRAERVFRDHHAFSVRELEEALEAARAAGCEAVVTTEKDAVRLPAELAADPAFRVVRIEARIVAGEEVLDELVDAALRAAPRPGPTARHVRAVEADLNGEVNVAVGGPARGGTTSSPAPTSAPASTSEPTTTWDSTTMSNPTMTPNPTATSKPTSTSDPTATSTAAVTAKRP
jgi:tetraacyldisaccharide 4'-kinase